VVLERSLDYPWQLCGARNVTFLRVVEKLTSTAFDGLTNA
jgi:hypothetical protein